MSVENYKKFYDSHMRNNEAISTQTLRRHRDQLFSHLRQLADLHMRHNVGNCRFGSQVDNHRLFYRGVERGIQLGLDHFLEQVLANRQNKPVALQLLEFKNEVLELSLMRPYRAMIKWKIVELDDLLDVERQDLLHGLHLGFTTVELTLPRLFSGQGRRLTLNRTRASQILAQ